MARASVRDAFVAKYGETDAAAIEKAANEHRGDAMRIGSSKGKGSDPFKWALCIAIGFECVSRESFRDHHGIKTPWADLRVWIRDHGELGSHDGDLDMLSLIGGHYDEFMPPKASAEGTP